MAAGDALRSGALDALRATISGLFFKRRDLKLARARVEQFKRDLFQAVQEDEALKLLDTLVANRLNREEIEEYRERVQRGRQRLEDDGGFGTSNSGGMVPESPVDALRSRMGGVADDVQVEVDDYNDYEYTGYEDDRSMYGPEDGDAYGDGATDLDDNLDAGGELKDGVLVDEDGLIADEDEYDDVLTPRRDGADASGDDDDVSNQFKCKRMLETALLSVHDRPSLKDFLASSVDRTVERPTDVPADPRRIHPIQADPNKAPDVNVVEQRKKGIFGRLFYAEDPLKMSIHYVLRTVGLVVSPVRALWDLVGLVLYGCGVGLSAVCRVVPVDAVASLPDTVSAGWTAVVDGLYAAYLGVNEATGGALAEVEWKLTEWKIKDGWSVVWGTGSVIYYTVFPPQDWDYVRPEAEEMRDWHARLRRELDVSETRLAKLQEQADSEAVFGDDIAYLALMDRCIELESPPYTYKLCPFKDAKQTWTSLGTYTGWLEPWPAVDVDALGPLNQTMVDGILGVEPGKSLLHGKAMTFRNGQQCWSGPKRQVNVFFYCADKTAITHVSEPSTCQYDMHVSTTAACSVELGKYLKAQLLELGMTAAEVAAATKPTTP